MKIPEVNSVMLYYSIEVIKGKGQPTTGCPFGEGIFIWGVIKIKYIGGGYVYYTSMNNEESVHKISCK